MKEDARARSGREETTTTTVDEGEVNEGMEASRTGEEGGEGRGEGRGEFVHLTKSKGRFIEGLLFVRLREEGERREGRVGEGSCGTEVVFIAFGGRKGSLASAVEPRIGTGSEWASGQRWAS